MNFFAEGQQSRGLTKSNQNRHHYLVYSCKYLEIMNFFVNKEKILSGSSEACGRLTGNWDVTSLRLIARQ